MIIIKSKLHENFKHRKLYGTTDSYIIFHIRLIKAVLKTCVSLAVSLHLNTLFSVPLFFLLTLNLFMHP